MKVIDKADPAINEPGLDGGNVNATASLRQAFGNGNSPLFDDAKTLAALPINGIKYLTHQMWFSFLPFEAKREEMRAQDVGQHLEFLPEVSSVVLVPRAPARGSN